MRWIQHVGAAIAIFASQSCSVTVQWYPCHELTLEPFDSYLASQNVKEPAAASMDWNENIPGMKAFSVPPAVGANPYALGSQSLIRAAECTLIPVPLFHDPTLFAKYNVPQQNIHVFVKRLYVPRSNATDPVGAIWVMNGGPGGSSVPLEPSMQILFEEMGGTMDVYTYEHRGVARSTALNCVASQAETRGSLSNFNLNSLEYQECLDSFVAFWGTNATYGFSTTEAAGDLYALIDLMNGANSKVFVYGVSYGTYVASRYMQVSKKLQVGTKPQAYCVILDGVVSTATFGSTSRLVFDDFDVQANQVGLQYLSLCSADKTCSSKFQGSPAATHALRPFIAPLIYRLKRCSPNDIVAVHSFSALLFGDPNQPLPQAQSEFQLNTILYNNIASTELSAIPMHIPSTEGLLFATGQNTTQLFGLWKKYPLDSYFNSFPATDSSVLIMNGDLDPQTPVQFATAQFNGIQAQRKWFVKFPGASHYTLGYSPTLTIPTWQKNPRRTVSHPNGTPLTCGMQVLLKFLANPDAAQPWTGCLTDLEPVLLNGYPDAPRARLINYFQIQPTSAGVIDLYEGNAVTASSVAAAVAQSLVLVAVLTGVAMCCLGILCGIILDACVLSHRTSKIAKRFSSLPSRTTGLAVEVPSQSGSML